MNKKNFNVVGNNETENQELAKGIAFIKSRRAELNVVQMVENMRDQALSNGVIINDAYCDRSMTRDYDREALNAFFATLKEEDFEVVVVRSLNDITDDIYDLEEFVKTITDMGIWLYSLEVGPVPITASHPVHVIVEPSEIRGYALSNRSDFMPEDIQTLNKGCVRFKSGYIPGESEIREAMDRAMIMQLNLLPVARKMVLEELEMKQNG